MSLNTTLLPAAPTWLWGRCGRHNSPSASSVMDLVFRRSDGCHVSVDTVHPSLLRSFSSSSPRWHHLQSHSSDVFLVSPHYVSKPFQSCFPAPLCDILYLQSLPGVIVSHTQYYSTHNKWSLWLKFGLHRYDASILALSAPTFLI